MSSSVPLIPPRPSPSPPLAASGLRCHHPRTTHTHTSRSYLATGADLPMVVLLYY